MCKECDATFVTETTLVHRHCQNSNLIVQQIALELQKEQVKTTIAKRLGISVTTVIRALLRKAAALNPTRQHHYLLSYFQRYPLEARRQVNWVVMVWYSPYLHLIQTCFPSARILIDKFHAVQHLNWALNRIRIETMNFQRYRSPIDYRLIPRHTSPKIQMTSLSFLEREHHLNPECH